LPRAQHQLNEAAKATDIIGMTVKNDQGQKLGKVDDLAVDVESGRIVQVILSSGGFVGMGDTLTAVPPEALHRDAAHKDLLLDADKEKLRGAPKFEMSQWAQDGDADHLSKVYSYYGQENAFRFVQTNDAVAAGQGNRDGSANTPATGKTDETCMIPASRLSQVQRASKLMGDPVKNQQGEKIGKVENILVDLPAGRMVAVVISSGGFLGMDDELSAIPPTALRFTTDRDGLQIDASKEMLSNAPHFKADQWPDFAQPGYAAGVYSAYHVQPYFTTAADNTARNVRDRDDRTLTPLDQGNSQADIDTTAEIRKEIIADKDMSINARNVKIITQNGHVTLRGPVNTAEEKRVIGEIADRIARSENVDNQLEVKLTASNN
jgi:sporulation protein YlmC with PRC-barrel domain